MLRNENSIIPHSLTDKIPANNMQEWQRYLNMTGGNYGSLEIAYDIEI